MTDSIQSNLSSVLTAAELAEQRRLVQFFNYPWPMGPVIVERSESEMAETKIEYADYTANTHRGCSKVHAGCASCYAETWANRFPAIFGRWGTEKQGGVRVVADLDKLFKQVRGWDQKAYRTSACAPSLNLRPPIVFWNDVSDTFEDWRGPLVDRHGKPVYHCFRCGAVEPGPKHPNDAHYGCADGGHFALLTLSDVRRRMFAEGIDPNQNLTHVLLTKRPENVRGMWPLPGWIDVFDGMRKLAERKGADPVVYRKNCWLLYSASDQATLESGLPHLLSCRDLCPVIGLSLEPLLETIDLRLDRWAKCTRPKFVIIGCEQLPGHKPGRFADGYADAALSLIRQCREAGVSVFHKQMPINGRVSGDPSEWPEDLRVREFPRG
jgi:protein gp37